MTFAMSNMAHRISIFRFISINGHTVLQNTTLHQDDHLNAFPAINQPGRRDWEHEGHAEGDQERREPQDVEGPQQGDDSFRSACTESCPTGARIH